MKKILLLVILGVAMSFPSAAQKHKLILKDTLDGKFDMSDYLINLHGFVPWPTIISEPALGSFGIGLAAVFMSPKKTAKPGEQYHFPDITGVAGMWTLNNTWGFGALRQGSFPSIGMRYTVGAGYVDAKMDYYRTFARLGEQEFSFRMKPVVGVLDISENLWKNRLFAGIRYEYTYMTMQYEFSSEAFDSVFGETTVDKNIGVLGIYAEFDSRNSIFTPDRGVRVKPTYSFGRNWTISDVDIDKFDMFVNVFFQPWRWWTCGLKVAGEAVNDGVPFYYYPYIDMRGIPMMHYQGQQVFQVETEERFDITKRWSLVGFFGAGRTWSDSKYLSDETWHYAGGAGFRYLVSRMFKLRMGIDLAASHDQFAYYIVFGHYWNR